MSNLQHLKAQRTQVLDKFPTKTFGNNGDIVISRIAGKGVFLCSKAGGMWYVANKMQELTQAGKASINSLSTNKIKVNRMINTENSPDKFIVNDGGNLRYRTGKQVVDDLPLPFNNIAYKTAYCSLGQYSDKDSCESNGGTWYYSENDSHDSISSTPENQLLTVGQSIGSVDAEPTLLYDGSTLEIKRNTNFDENWHTSTQGTLLKLRYDSDNSSSISMDSTGGMNFNLHKEDASFNFYESGLKRVSINTGDGLLKLHNPVSTGAGLLEYFSIDIDDNAVTTIKTFDSGGTVGHLTLQPDGDLILDPASNKTIINATDGLYFDGGTHTYITESAADILDFYAGGVNLLRLSEAGGGASDRVAIPAQTGLYFDGGTQTYIAESSADTLSFVVGGVNLVDMVEATTSSVNINNSHLTLDATKKIHLDGNIIGDTYITETSADSVRLVVGGDILLQLVESGDDGNVVHFRSASAGFTRLEATFSTTGIIGSGGTDDTDIDFRFSNKYRLEMTGDITTINLIFPNASGNFLLVCTTNGDHDVSNWKVFESDESAATTTDVLWAGGSIPAFTNNGVDIVSFYWDANEQQAYGVASLAFATP